MTAKEYNSKIDNYKNKIKEIQDVLLEKYKKIIESEVKDLCKEAISDFYSDYDPIFYRRNGDLKNVFKVEINIKDQTFELKFDSSFMKYAHGNSKHSINNSYIFDTAFMQGWHGGANKIKSSKAKKWGKHPDGITPYWRTPHPAVAEDGIPYREWGRPAEISESPYEVIMSRMPDLEASLNMRMRAEYSRKMKPIINEIKKLYYEYYG